MPLRLSSLGFAVFWTAGMLWWTAPLTAAKAVILGSCGAIAGLLFHLMMGKWLAFQSRR